jgi:hypothetical protein
MDRVSAPNYATVGGIRVFVDPDLATNTEGTGLNAVWHNGVQESILAPVTAAGLMPTDSDNTQLLQAMFALPGKNVQVFSASGTFVVPADVTKVHVLVLGGGSGAEGCNGSVFAGACGAGGGWAIKLCAVTPAASIPVTVGAGGAGSAAGAASGAGGTSSFGTFCSATGGAPTSVNAGGTGGTGIGGDIVGSGSDGSDGMAPATLPNWPGLSGGSLFGGGRRSGSGGGYNGGAPGAGGSAPYTVSAATISGANGAAGIVIVRW